MLYKVFKYCSAIFIVVVLALTFITLAIGI
jgi:hypothetical protein